MKNILIAAFLMSLALPAISQSKPVYLDDNTFKTKVFDWENNTEWNYQGDKPAIIDFYADWCRPCKMLAPVLDELAKEYEGKIVIYKVNTEKAREVSAAFGISSIPALLFVPASGQPQMAQGFLPKETLESAINDVLKVSK